MWIVDFMDWLSDLLDSLWDAVKSRLQSALAWLVVIVTLPLWILPFGYWWIFVRGRK